MKRIKYFFIAALLSLSASLTQSCSVDDNIEYITEAGTVSYLAETNSQYTQIIGDDSGLSYLLNNSALKWVKADSVGQRIIYTYHVEKSKKDAGTAQEIKIHYIYKMLTKNMDTLKTDEEDEFGKDLININWIYVSANHLNIKFTIRRDNPNIAHRISLVAQEGAKPDENGTLNLDLRHNQYNDMPYHPSEGYVSYTLESIPGYKEGTLKKIIINCQNTSTETTKYEIAIKKESSNGSILKSTSTDDNTICLYQ